EELDVAAGREPQLRRALRPSLRDQLLAYRGRLQREPGRIEQRQVVRVERYAIAALERMIREKHVERTALVEHTDIGDDPIEVDRIPVVPVDAVQTRRPARHVVRLRLDRHEPRLVERASGKASPRRLAARHAATTDAASRGSSPAGRME